MDAPVTPAGQAYELRSALQPLLVRVAVVIAFAVLAWQLADVLLLIFGAILIAILLRSLSDLLARFLPLEGIWPLLLGGLLIMGLLAGFAIIMGAEIWTQVSELVSQLPELIRALEDRLGMGDIEAWLADQAREVVGQGGVVARVAGYSSFLAGILGNLVLAIAVGIYLSIRPDVYCYGAVKIVSPDHRPTARETLEAVGRALRLWLLGQLLAMLLVGALTTLGLWLIGIPSALALGIFAGLAEFVPFVGPIVSAIPALLLALSQDVTTTLWVLGLYLAIQQIEGNLITPLIQQRAVDLPPALTLVAVITFGVLFGFLGVLFATPLAVVAFVAVKKLWIRDTLEERTELPGEE